MKLEDLEPPARSSHALARELDQIAFEPERAAGEAREHVNGCELCRSAVAALEDERRRFLIEHPPHRFLETMPAPKPRPRWRSFGALVFAASLGAIVSFVLSGPVDPLDRPGENGVALRGATALSLSIHLSRGGRDAAPLDPQTILRRGDVLRFVVSSPVDCWATIVNLDDRGRTERYLPKDVGSLRIRAGAAQIVPGAIELDDFIGRELVFLICSATPLESGAVERAIERAYREHQGELTSIRKLDLEALVDRVLLSKGPP